MSHTFTAAQAHFRLVMVTEDFSRMAGGIPVVVHELSGRMAARGIETHVVFSHVEPMPPAPGVIPHHVPPSRIGRKWYYGPGLGSVLNSLASNATPTVFHIHGAWSGPQYLAAKAAISNRIPYMISAHGMLEPWLWNHQRLHTLLKKKIYWRLCAEYIYRKATVLHGITPLEADNLRALIPRASVEIIPNAIDTTAFDQAQSMMPREKMILFIGRLDPKKGVDLLLRAFVAANLDSGWRLVIAGPSSSESYMEKLRMLASRAAAGSVHFLGPIFGQEKTEYLKRAWILVVPSHSEVVGLVNLEAAMQHLPSITTHQTGLNDWEQGGGLLIQPDEVELTRALERVCSWRETERIERGDKSFSFVRKSFSWDVVESMWMDLYHRLASGQKAAASAAKISTSTSTFPSQALK